ncbi:Uu.00g055140.m01.CDS01 [Anthostomella pinea]|uniref:Uu.00g055140.m01.CDS01 n=1 Tax=Anthostomella pinea TaxID=933095 RepID=A0AAI8YPK5_9PEZI|nr:Uu.00g055140.m01.CDS01 [Anthostomella pinea]
MSVEGQTVEIIKVVPKTIRARIRAHNEAYGVTDPWAKACACGFYGFYAEECDHMAHLQKYGCGLKTEIIMVENVKIRGMCELCARASLDWALAEKHIMEDLKAQNAEIEGAKAIVSAKAKERLEAKLKTEDTQRAEGDQPRAER